MIIVLLAVISLQLITTNKIQVQYLKSFDYVSNLDNLQRKTKTSTAGTASFPEFTIARSNTELLYKIPLRSAYFLFSPFPWDIRGIRHVIGMIDGCLYRYLVYLILRNIRFIWKDVALRTILLILLSYILVFSVGVGNFGTGIRHRTKFLVIIILLAAPFN